MSDVDFVSLRTFVAVCEFRNLSEVARHFGTTQAAVSLRLKRLETHMRVRLIDRALRPLEPTPAGQVLLERARRILAEVNQAEVDLSKQNNLPLRELRLGVADSLGAALVPPLVDAIKDSIQQLAVRVDSSAALCKLLLSRDLHAVVSSDPLAHREDLQRLDLYHEPMVLVFHGKEEITDDSQLSVLKQLANTRPFIRYSPISPLAQQIETHLLRLGLAPPHNLEFNTSEGIMEMVRHKLGWTITTPLCLLQGRGDFQQLSIRRLPFSGMSRTICLLARREELGSLPLELAKISRDIIGTHVVRRIERHLPWLAPMLGVPSEKPVSNGRKRSALRNWHKKSLS
jgi:DNA-binding transcriptional LysR family regulator